MMRKKDVMNMRKICYDAKRPRNLPVADYDCDDVGAEFMGRIMRLQGYGPELQTAMKIEYPEDENGSPSPMIGWCPPSPSQLNKKFMDLIDKPIIEEPSCIKKGGRNRRKSILNLDRPVRNELGKPKRICFDNMEDMECVDTPKKIKTDIETKMDDYDDEVNDYEGQACASSNHLTTINQSFYDECYDMGCKYLDNNEKQSKEDCEESSGSSDEQIFNLQVSNWLKDTNQRKQKSSHLLKRLSLDDEKQRRNELENDEQSACHEKFKKYHSNQESNIKSCLDNEDEQANLIADFSAPYILPLIQQGKHSDLKAITHETMREVMQQKYSDRIGQFTIVDCRYPYEFEGGHINGAINLYTKQAIMQEFLSDNNSKYTTRQPNKQNILIFHCEFSSERGPKMCRFLRNKDRELNQDNYPHLNYPEIYLLENGYKEFYMHHKQLCYPSSYTPMLHKAFTGQLSKFRAQSKSFNDKSEKRSQSRVFSRLGSKRRSLHLGGKSIQENDDVGCEKLM